jgi:hypothetical protein
VDHKLGKFSAPLVAIAAVPDKELGEMAELVDRKVRRQARLSPFLAHDSDPHIRGLDHGHIVASVADAADPFLRELLDQFGNICLLCR